jgi:CRISPR-associated endonuclease Csn1
MLKHQLFDELNIKGNLTVLEKHLNSWGISQVSGNLTTQFWRAIEPINLCMKRTLKILDFEGYDVKDLLKIKLNKDEVDYE